MVADLNGVFKGGGAKGLLYAGALQALADHKRWFRAVAGTSAGAITATLIAAGVHPEELGELAAEAMGKLSKNWLFDLGRQPFVKAGGLERWLDDQLDARVPRNAEEDADRGPVTFSELYDATGIELYVVCVDVAERQPLVFHSALTPDLGVARAVLASAAIPLAFAPGRLRVALGECEAVHRLMDGGVWANYPTFVFREPSFRTYHHLFPIPAGTITIGFTLDQHEPAFRPQPVCFEDPSRPARTDRGAGLRGWLRNPIIRIYFLTVAPLVLLIEAVWTTNKYGLLVIEDNLPENPTWWANALSFFNGFFTRMSPGTWTVIAITAAFALGMLLIGATAIDVTIPAFRTLASVGTDVPYWAGADPEDRIVRIGVPPGLGTLSLTLSPDERAAVIAHGRSEAERQLPDALAPIGESA